MESPPHPPPQPSQKELTGWRQALDLYLPLPWIPRSWRVFSWSRTQRGQGTRHPHKAAQPASRRLKPLPRSEGLGLYPAGTGALEGFKSSRWRVHF